MDTIGKFHIYKETKNCKQINDKNTVKPSIMFDIVVRGEPDSAHSLKQPTNCQSLSSSAHIQNETRLTTTDVTTFRICNTENFAQHTIVLPYWYCTFR